MPEVTISTEPQEAEIEEEISWQSVLSEVREAILAGFSSLRSEMTLQREAAEARENRLLESNTNLTSLITQANQTLMDKVTTLTLIPSIPEVVVIPEVEPTPESVGEESPEALTETVPESEAVPARAKRRTL